MYKITRLIHGAWDYDGKSWETILRLLPTSALNNCGVIIYEGPFCDPDDLSLVNILPTLY